MSKEDVAFVKNAYDAFNRDDIQAVFGALDPAVQFYQSEEVPWGGRYQGHMEVGAFLQKLTSANESKFKADQSVDSGDQVVALGYTRGIARAPGKEFEVPAVHVWTLKNGKVLRFDAYIDNPRMIAAVHP
jgi:ketosteroid isomerase-like protein